MNEEIKFISLTRTNTAVFVSIMGYNFDWLTNVFLSSGEVTFPSLTSIDKFTTLRRVSAICPEFSGYEIDTYTTIGRNRLTLTATTDMWTQGPSACLDVIFMGPAGYTKLSDKNFIIKSLNFNNIITLTNEDIVTIDNSYLVSI